MPERRFDVTIRPFCKQDRPAVASLYARVFGELEMTAFLRRWDWQFHRNPASDAANCLMWVAEARGELAGFLASFPARFKLLENDAIIRLPCDLMVSTEARGRGVGEKLIRAYTTSEDLIVNALGYTPAAGRMYHRLGYREVHAERVRVRPCNLRPIIRDLLTRAHRRSGLDRFVSSVAGVSGRILNLGLWALNRATAPVCSDRFEIRQCTAADAAFDELWQRVSPAFPISAVRDSRWVQWRFLEDPCFEHALLCGFDQGGRVLGYVDVRVSIRRKLRLGRILDLFCDPGTPEVAESLIAAGIARLEAEGVDMITCLGHLPGLQRVIGKYCYLTPRRLQKPALFLWKGEPDLANVVYDTNSWHLTHADGDDGFSP